MSLPAVACSALSVGCPVQPVRAWSVVRRVVVSSLGSPTCYVARFAVFRSLPVLAAAPGFSEAFCTSGRGASLQNGPRPAPLCLTVHGPCVLYWRSLFAAPSPAQPLISMIRHVRLQRRGDVRFRGADV